MSSVDSIQLTLVLWAHAPAEDSIRSKVVMKGKALLSWRKSKKKHRNDNPQVPKVPSGLTGLQGRMWGKGRKGSWTNNSKSCWWDLGRSEKAMAPHSSTLAWKIPWMEEPGGLQSMGSLGVRHNWATSLSLFTFMHWRRKWQPTPAFLPEESQGRGSLLCPISGVTQSRTRLKWLSIA